jgi:hypothetical protein
MRPRAVAVHFNELNSDISKRVGEGVHVFTFCVVLDQSTVIFQKGRYYNLCGIAIKIVAMLWLWSNSTTIVITHICVIFSRKQNSASLPNGPTSI